MLRLLSIMMVYAASVDSPGTVLSTVIRVSLRMHHVLLLVVGRAIGPIIPGIITPDYLLVNLFMSTKSTWKKLNRTPKL
jgi:hypothetical protein